MGGQAKNKRKNKGKRRETRSTAGPGLAGLSAQERMKVKMHEKVKKKTSEKYSIDQLLNKTEECMDNFDFPMARLFCQRALDIEPTNLAILDMLGNICAELGDVEKAKQVFLRAVELSPEEGHSKYMYLGQIHTGKEAVQYFSKGIEVMLNASDEHTRQASAQGAAAFPSEEAPPVTGKEVSVAFCSLAEIFFTDLCMEEGAAERCKEAIEKALQYDQHNPEALQLMASYLFSIEKTQEGRDYLLRSVSSWLPSLHKEEEPSPGAEREDTDDEEPALSNVPPYESRITTAKLLIEAEEFEMATEVLEGLLEEDDEVVQVWYLLGWVYYLQLDKSDDKESLRKLSRTYLSKSKKLYTKFRCEDAPMLEHAEQLLGELGGGQDHEEEDEDEDAGPSLDGIGDDFIQSSDEEEENDSMEH